MKVAFTIMALATMFAVPAVAQYASEPTPVTTAETYYKAEIRVSDTPFYPVWDQDLKNPWGLTAYRGIEVWSANNGSNLSTIHKKSTLEQYQGGIALGLPTGVVSVPGGDFEIKQSGHSGSSQVIFATQDGNLMGWNKDVSYYNAIEGFYGYGNGDRFQGLAIAQDHTGDWRLYAADSSHSNIAVFNDRFKQIGTFTDASVPAGFAPFNIQTLHGKLYVAFGKKEAVGDNEAVGKGLGFVDVFNPAGRMLARLVSGGELNAPWGLAIAPDSFGAPFANALLVGNVGDGEINAYNAATGAFIDKIRDKNGGPLKIAALRALLPTIAGNIDYSAGSVNGRDGVLGILHPITTPAPAVDTSLTGR